MNKGGNRAYIKDVMIFVVVSSISVVLMYYLSGTKFGLFPQYILSVIISTTLLFTFNHISRITGKIFFYLLPIAIPLILSFVFWLIYPPAADYAIKYWDNYFQIGSPILPKEYVLLPFLILEMAAILFFLKGWKNLRDKREV